MTTQSTESNLLREFGARASFIVSDVEAIDLSADREPSRTDSRGVKLVPIGVLVTVAGNIKVDMLGGTSGVALPFAVGYHPFSFAKVYSTANGTTATGLFWLYGDRKNEQGGIL